MAEIDLFAGTNLSDEDLFSGIDAPEERSAFSKALIPTGGKDISLPDNPKLETLAKTGIATLEILDLPKRFLGSLRGMATGEEGLEISNPESALFGPEAKKIEEAAGKLPLSIPAKFGAKVAAEVLREGPTLGVGFIAKGAKSIAERAIKGRGVALNRVFEKINKLSEEAFSFIKKEGKEGVKQLEGALGKAKEIGDEIRNIVFNRPKELFPENLIVDKSIDNMGDIPIKKTIDKLFELRKTISGRTEIADKTKDIIDRQIKKLENPITTKSLLVDAEGKPFPTKVTKDKAISARSFKQTQEDLDAVIGDFDNAPPALKKRITRIYKGVRAQMRADLRRVAVLTNNPEFLKAMDGLAKKNRAIDNLKFKFGTNEESFVATAFGKNKKQRQQAFGAIEDAFGIKITERAKLAKLADELEPRDFIDGRLSAPRNPESLFGIGSMISPNMAKNTMVILEKLGTGTKVSADIAVQFGIKPAEFGAVVNFLKKISELDEE